MDYVLLDNFIRRANEYAKSSEKYRKESAEWLKIADDDLKASKLLYENNMLPQATYFLEQAFEKLSKAYFLYMGSAEPSDVYGHQITLDKLKKMIRTEFLDNSLTVIKDLNKEMTGVDKIDVEIKKEVLDVLENDEDGIRLLNKNNLEAIFRLINIISEKLLDKQVLLSVEKKIKQRKFQRNLRHLVFMINHFRVSYGQVDDIVEKFDAKKYIKSSSLSIKLLMLGLITFVHYNTPRYPYDKFSKVNYFNYNTDMGIIQTLPQLYSYAQEISDHLNAEVKNIKTT